MNKKRVLIVDDDNEIRNVLKLILGETYQISEAENGHTGVEMAKSQNPDLILLDLKMPKVSGFEVCEALRSDPSTKDIPIIILTASSEKANLTLAFDKGADDFIEKPFHTAELLARVAYKLKKKINAQKICIGDISIDSKSMQVSIAGNPVNFSTLEFNLLRFFADHKDVVISREKVLENVWNSVCVSDRTVDTHIVSLRKKINSSKCKLQTIYGAGYKLTESHAG